MRSGVLHWARAVRLGGTCALLAAMSLAAAGSAPRAAASTAAPPPQFQFVRLAYADDPDSGFGRFGGFGGRGSWLTDAPEAEQHFLQGMTRLTRIDAAADSKGLRVMDDELFDHPFLYAVEVGRWHLSDEEAARLREYLLRGGFLMVDDFHGSLQWEGFMESMRRVFPDRPVIDVPDDHEVFHVLFDLDQRTQIPGLYTWLAGRTWERDGRDPRWRGIFDADGRLMVAINFNMDLGDAWEHADTPQYPQPLTALAYRFGVNYVLYTMTH